MTTLNSYARMGPLSNIGAFRAKKEETVSAFTEAYNGVYFYFYIIVNRLIPIIYFVNESIGFCF